MTTNQMVWRNRGQFSADVRETAHDGHRVEIVRALTPQEADEEVGPMYVVRCLDDSVEFQAFSYELEPACDTPDHRNCGEAK